MVGHDFLATGAAFPARWSSWTAFFDQVGGDFAVTGLLDCQLPSRNHMFTREAHQWSYLPLVLRLLLGAGPKCVSTWAAAINWSTYRRPYRHLA